MTTEDRVRTVREAYQAAIQANEDGLPWNNPWAAVVAALDAHDEPHTKALAETATRLGYELGRKEAGEEIASALDRRAAMNEAAVSGDPYIREGLKRGYRTSAEVARYWASLPQKAASDSLAAPTGRTHPLAEETP